MMMNQMSLLGQKEVQEYEAMEPAKPEEMTAESGKLCMGKLAWQTPERRYTRLMWRGGSRENQ